MSNGTSLTIRQKVDGIRNLLAKAKDQIAMALPKHCNAERMLRVTMTAVQKTPALLDCDPLSVIGSVVAASQLGLEPDGVLGHAYLVPFNNKKTGKKECQLIPGYKGLIDLCRRSGAVSTIYARVAYEQDKFAFSYGLEPKLEHVPSDVDDPGAMVAAYAVCRLRDGGVQFEVMWKRQIDSIRKRSRAGDSGPWVTDYEEMAKKTVLRRLCKLLPVSVELQKVVALDEHAEAGISQGMASVLDARVQEATAPTDTLDAIADELQPAVDAGSKEDADHEEITVSQWCEEVSGLNTAGELAEARRTIPQTFSPEGQHSILSAIEMREATILGTKKKLGE